MKSEFSLEHAVWPVLVVDSAGVIRRANAAAENAFNIPVLENSTRLEAVWAAGNDLTAAQFIAGLEPNAQPLASLKLQAKGAPGTVFRIQSCPFLHDGQNGFLLQLFAPDNVKAESVDAGVAQKQKLDCALKLSRTVALDFNNALTSILGHTSLLLRKIEPDNPWRGSLVEVEKSAEKAAEIAHDLAVFSRQEKDTRTQVAGNLNDLLRRTVDLFRLPAVPVVDWKLHLESKLYTVNFDEAKLQQAFMKILENAMQALGEEGRIVVLSRNRDLAEPTQDGAAKLPAGCYVCVDISDNGKGLSPEVLPRIFEPFFTTKSGHRGLGLAWVYGIITNHGGSVAVSSQPGGGASFRVYLPAHKRFIQEKSFRDEELRGHQTILIVDDEDLLLTMGQMILSSFGYRVLTANSGQRALEIVGKADRKIDLIITDLVMPNMSGRELIERLKVVAPEIPIICSSGYLRSSKAEEDAGEYLQKPFTSQDLLLKVKQVLNPRDEPA